MNIAHLSPASLKRIEAIIKEELHSVETEIQATTERIKGLYERRNELLKDLGEDNQPLRIFRPEAAVQAEARRKKRILKRAPMRNRQHYAIEVLKQTDRPLSSREIAERICKMEGITSSVEVAHWIKTLSATMSFYSDPTKGKQVFECARHNGRLIYLLKSEKREVEKAVV